MKSPHSTPSQAFPSRRTITAALLALAVLLLTVLVWIGYNDRQAQGAQAQADQAEIQASLEERLSEKGAELETRSAQLTSAASTLQAFERNSTDSSTSLDAQSATQTMTQSDYNVMVATQAALLAVHQEDQAALAQLQAQQTCANSSGFKADFASNAAMSKALKAFVGEIGGSIAIGTWDLVWPGSLTTLHRVTVFQDDHSFINIFLVYFNQAEGPARGVFWVNRACWLDR